VSSAFDEDPAFPELELLEVVLCLMERVAHEQHDRGQHSREDVFVSVGVKTAGLVHHQPSLAPDDEHVLQGSRESQEHLPGEEQYDRR